MLLLLLLPDTALSPSRLLEIKYFQLYFSIDLYLCRPVLWYGSECFLTFPLCRVRRTFSPSFADSDLLRSFPTLGEAAPWSPVTFSSQFSHSVLSTESDVKSVEIHTKLEKQLFPLTLVWVSHQTVQTSDLTPG